MCASQKAHLNGYFNDLQMSPFHLTILTRPQITPIPLRFVLVLSIFCLAFMRACKCVVLKNIFQMTQIENRFFVQFLNSNK